MTKRRGNPDTREYFSHLTCARCGGTGHTGGGVCSICDGAGYTSETEQSGSLFTDLAGAADVADLVLLLRRHGDGRHDYEEWLRKSRCHGAADAASAEIVAMLTVADVLERVAGEEPRRLYRPAPGGILRRLWRRLAA